MKDRLQESIIVTSRLLLSLFAFLVFLNLNLEAEAQQSANLKDVRLQLKWKHQFQFAGYYAAIEKGYYTEEGINTQLIEAKPGEVPGLNVFEGKAEFGIAASDVILMRNSNYKPVVLATIFQHSAQVLLYSTKSPIYNIHNLAGKSIGLESHAADILAYLHDEGITLDSIDIKHHSFNANQLINGSIDALSAYITDEPFILDSIGFDYHILSPLSGGIDFYGDLLFCSEELIKKDPKLVTSFLNASLRGWKYALNNQEEIINLIYSKYSKRHSIEHLRFEADETAKLILPNVVEIGYTNRGRWNTIAKTYRKLQLIKQDDNLEGMFYNDYIDKSNPIPWKTILISLSGILLIGIILAVIYYILLKLKYQIKIRKHAETKLIQNEEKYKSVMINAADAIFLHDLKGNIIDVNNTATSLYGYTKQEFLRMKVQQIDVDFDERVEIGKFWENLEKDKVATLVTNQIIKDKSVIQVEIRLTPIVIDNRKVILAIVRDITEKKVIETKLRQSEQKYRNLYEKSSDANLILENGVFTDCNEATLKMLQFVSKKDIIGKTPNELSPDLQPSGESSESLANENITKAKELGYHRFQWVHTNSKNEWMFFDVALTYLPSIGSDTFYTVWRDITEIKQAQAELNEYHKNLEGIVERRTNELQAKNTELKSKNEKLEQYNELFVGREFRIKELKEKLKELENKLKF